jgi:hypothetical protein
MARHYRIVRSTDFGLARSTGADVETLIANDLFPSTLRRVA